jgi:hypothetical protein
MKLKEEQIIKLVKSALTNDLRKPRYRSNPNKLAGHCYVAIESLYYLLDGYKPFVMWHEGDTHWFLRNNSGKVIDPTVSQFKTRPNYKAGRGCGFLTSLPSKRSQEVLRRVRNSILFGKI